MVSTASFVGFLAVTLPALVNAAPAPNPAGKLVERATCTFTSAASAIASKAACATIVIDAISVPAGTTLDLTDL